MTILPPWSLFVHSCHGGLRLAISQPESRLLLIGGGCVKSIICQHLSWAHFCHSEAASRRIFPSKGRLVSMGDPSASSLRMTGMSKRGLNNDFDTPPTEVGVGYLLVNLLMVGSIPLKLVIER